MKVLFDQGVPVPLRRQLPDCAVRTVYEEGWATLVNGDLLRAAEATDYDVLVTTDQNLRYQQNLTERQIAILVLMSTSWPRIQQVIPAIREALSALQPGAYVEVAVPQTTS